MSTTTERMWPPPVGSFSSSNASDYRPPASDIYPKRGESLHGSHPEMQSTKLMTPALIMSSSPRSPSNRGKLHKRDSSSSSLTTTPISAFPAYDMSYDAMIKAPPTAHQEASATSKSKVTLKPLLRKLAPQESSASLDLSRSAAENEGLGIYTSANVGREHRGGSDASHSQISNSRRGYHRRTTSGTSQVSATTTSSTHRAGSHYVHPMRQTPQSYTPPFSHSYQNSRSSEFGAAVHAAHDSAPSWPVAASLPHAPPASFAYGSLPSSDPVWSRSPLQIRTSSPSHHTVPGTPSSLRYADSIAHGAELAASIPGTSRSSMDSSFRLKRSRTNTATTLDPAVTQATVNVLRAEFAAREAAKDAKYQMAEARALEREKLRREKRDESARRKDEADQRKRARSVAGSEASRTVGAVDYGSVKAHPVATGDVEMEKLQREREKTRRMRARPGTAAAEPIGGGLPKKKKPVKAVKSQWSLFLFQCKTMWLKIKRSMGIGSG